MPAQEVFFNIEFIATISVSLASLLLGTIVYFRANVNNLQKNIFLGASVSVFLWSFANYFSLTFDNHLLLLVRLVLFFAVIEQFLFYLLVYLLSKKATTLKDKRVIFAAILAFITMLATLSPFVFTSIQMVNGVAVPQPGPLIPLFTITILLFFFLGGVELVKAWKNSSGENNMQIKYIAVGYFSMFILLISTQFIFTALLKNTSFIKLGPIFILPFIILTGYAIFRHNLFNIRVVATEIFTGLVMFIFLVNVFFFNSIFDFIANIVMLVFVIISSILLIRGTIREIKTLEELSEKKSEFLSIASHQLRTPISIIKGYLSMLREGSFGKLSEKQLEVINKTYTANERMLSLMDDFLNLSRIEKGKLEYYFKKEDLRDMINNTVEHLETSAEAKNITLNWKNPTSPIYALVDENKFNQIISNLIDNAIKYTPEGGKVSINISEEDEFSKNIRIYVKDNGIGIEKDELTSIFESFERGERGKKENVVGSGIGLYVAKTIVKGHSGKIWVESGGEGKGSTFVVEIPGYHKASLNKKI